MGDEVAYFPGDAAGPPEDLSAQDDSAADADVYKRQMYIGNEFSGLSL